MTVWLGIIALSLGLGTSLFLPVPQNLKTSFDAGQSLYALGEYEGAIIEYSKIVKFSSRAVRADSVRVAFGDELELPVVAAAWYQLGNAYKRSGQHDQAVDAFHHVIEMESVAEDFRSLVQFQVADTRFLQKEFDKAAVEYKRYVDLFPKSELAGQAFFYAGWSEFNLKKYDQAIETLRAMLEVYPEDRYSPDSQFRIASSFYEKGDYPRAIEEAEKVLEQHPNSPVIAQATYLEANAYDKMARDEEAIAAYRDVRGLYDRMFELLRGSFREGKNVDFENYRQLFETSSLRVAEIHRRRGNFQEAYQELIAAQETAEERFYKAKVQMRLGDNYMEWAKSAGDPAVQEKHFDDAYTAYNQVIALYGDTGYPPNAQYQKGEARYFAGNYAAARDEYVGVVEQYPDSDTDLRAAALYSAGWSSEKLQDPDRSLELYADVAANFPRSAQAPLCLLRIGRINTEQQRYDDAVTAYRAITEEYGGTRHAADANYGLGMLYKTQGKPDEAVAAFRAVGRDAGKVYVVSLVEAAKIHIEEARPAEGRKLLTELLTGVTGDRDLESTAHYQMGQLEFGIKNYNDAIGEYTVVIDQYPGTDPVQDAHYGRGLAYHYAGRYSGAVEDYKWLLDHDLPASMVLKVEFSMALSLAASGKDAEATAILTRVIDSGDETLARNAQLQLISMAEKQDPQDAIRTYESMLSRLESEEDRVRVLIRLASAYFRLGEYDESIAASQRLLDIAIDENDVANALFVQGNSHFRARNYQKAVETYQTIIDNYPQMAWAKNAQFQIGAAYNTLSGSDIEYLPRMSRAFEAYYTNYADDEMAPVAYYYDAWARYRMGRWRDASETFEALARRFPRAKYAPESLFRSGEAVYNLAQSGTLDQRKAVYEEAMALYEAVVSRYPDSEYVDDSLYNKAWALISLGDKAAALPIFEQIVTEHPDGRYGAQSQFTLGDYYYGEKDYAQATASYEQFLELYPESRLSAKDQKLRRKANILLGHLAEIDAYNLYAEGEKLFDQKSYDEAIEIFKQVQEKYPDSDQSVNAAVNMGAAYMAMEDYRQSGEQFKNIVDRYGEMARFAPQVDFARQQLEALEEAGVL